MLINISINNKNYCINTKNSFDISIPYEFNGAQPNFYDVKRGELKSFESNGKIYSVAYGASCNVPEISLNIHCSGTHTECVGHLLVDTGDVGLLLREIFIPAILITVSPNTFGNKKESYHCNVSQYEQVILKESIKTEIEKRKNIQPQALVIRTKPNPEQKKYYHYSKHTPPFFTNDALQYISGLDILHLVVDLPSLDRMEDNGLLGNHRIFWGDGKNADGDINKDSEKTVTELAFISDEIPDGFYFLNIQLPHFKCDAAPSRPILLKPN